MIAQRVAIPLCAARERALTIHDDICPRQLAEFVDGSQSTPHRSHDSDRPELVAHSTVIDPYSEILVHA